MRKQTTGGGKGKKRSDNKSLPHNLMVKIGVWRNDQQWPASEKKLQGFYKQRGCRALEEKLAD